MLRYIVAVVIMSVTCVSAAMAQSRGTEAQRRACGHDVSRYCRRVIHDGDFAIANCLRAHYQRIRPACRRVLEGGPG